MTRKRSGLLSLLLEGAAVGIAATQALDWLSTLIYEREDVRTRAAENAARGGLHAYERGILRISRRFGKRLDSRQVGRWGWRFHKTFGIGMGLAYAALRRRYPSVGVGYGLAAGAVFFLVGDELLMPLLGWTPGPRAFSWKVHGRGAVSHIAYGVAAEATARAFARAERALA